MSAGSFFSCSFLDSGKGGVPEIFILCYVSIFAFAKTPAFEGEFLFSVGIFAGSEGVGDFATVEGEMDIDGLFTNAAVHVPGSLGGEGFSIFHFFPFQFSVGKEGDVLFFCVVYQLHDFSIVAIADLFLFAAADPGACGWFGTGAKDEQQEEAEWNLKSLEKLIFIHELRKVLLGFVSDSWQTEQRTLSINIIRLKSL